MKIWEDVTMKKRQNNLFWGIALIVVGAFFMALNSGWIPTLSDFTWPIIMAAISLLFFVAYYSGGNSNWGLLFPAVGTGAVAVAVWLANAEVEGTIVGGLFMLLLSIPFWVGFMANRSANWGLLIPGWILAAIGLIVMMVGRSAGELIGAMVMFSMALPFFVVYFINRKNWWALIPGWVLAAIGLIVLLASSVSGELIGSLVMFAIAFPFFVVYLINRQNWWALIPGWATAAIGVIVLLTSVVSGEMIGALVMFAIALPFFAVYFINRQYWWALIPGWVTAAIGVIVLLAGGVAGEWMGALVMFAFALPFFFIFLSDQDKWWALIPAGVMVSIGLTAGLAGIEMAESLQVRLLGGVLFAGFGITFAILWSMRKQQDTGWAKYPAAGLGAAACLVILFGAEIEVVWSVLLIGAGLWLLLRRAPAPEEKELKLLD
jgi:hypothetical protein